MPSDIPALPLRAAVLAVTFCFSGFFSGSETALFSFQPHELELMSEPDAGRLEQMVAGLRQNPRRLLITVLFGNMVVNVVFFSVSYMLILELRARLPAGGPFLLGLASLLAIIIGGEVMPKNFAVTFYRRFGLAVAFPLLALQKLLLPVLWPLEKVADATTALMGRRGPPVGTAELEMLVRMSAEEGVVDEGAGDMIGEVIGLSEVQVSELMVPRVDLVSFDLQDPEQELMPLFEREKLSVVPVYRGTMDQMRGVLRIKDVMFKPRQQPLEELVIPIPFLPETIPADAAIRRCRREGVKSAFVVDEYGAVEGLVTIEDLLEEIVGDIADEYDRAHPRPVQPLEDGVYRVDGGLSLREWEEFAGVETPPLEVDTVGGLVMALLEKVPEAGDRAECEGMQFTVERVEGRRAGTVLVELSQRPPQGESNRG